MHRSRPWRRRQNIHDDWLYRDELHFIAEVVGWLWLLTAQNTWRGSPGSTVSCIEAFILYFVFLVFFVDISFWCRRRWGGGGEGVGKWGAKRWWAEKGIRLRTMNDHTRSGYP